MKLLPWMARAKKAHSAQFKIQMPGNAAKESLQLYLLVTKTYKGAFHSHRDD